MSSFEDLQEKKRQIQNSIQEYDKTIQAARDLRVAQKRQTETFTKMNAVLKEVIDGDTIQSKKTVEIREKEAKIFAQIPEYFYGRKLSGLERFSELMSVTSTGNASYAASQAQFGDVGGGLARFGKQYGSDILNRLQSFATGRQAARQPYKGYSAQTGGGFSGFAVDVALDPMSTGIPFKAVGKVLSTTGQILAPIVKKIPQIEAGAYYLRSYLDVFAGVAKEGGDVNAVKLAFMQKVTTGSLDSIKALGTHATRMGGTFHTYPSVAGVAMNANPSAYATTTIKGLEDYWFTKGVAQAVEGGLGTVKTGKDIGGATGTIVTAIDTMSAWYRRFITLNPRFWTRNQSDLMLKGGISEDPIHYASGLYDWLKQPKAVKDAMKEAMGNKTTMGQVGGGNAWPLARGLGWQEQTFGRGPTIMNAMKRGVSKEQAIINANELWGAADDVFKTLWEKQWGRRLDIFWDYDKMNMTSWATLLGRRSGFMASVFKAQDALEPDIYKTNPQLKPSWVAGRFQMGPISGSGSSFEDAARMVSGDKNTWMSRFNPYASTAIELANNKTYFSGQSITENTRPGPYRTAASGIQAMVGYNGQTVDPYLRYTMEHLGGWFWNSVVQASGDKPIIEKIAGILVSVSGKNYTEQDLKNMAAMKARDERTPERPSMVSEAERIVRGVIVPETKAYPSTGLGPEADRVAWEYYERQKAAGKSVPAMVPGPYTGLPSQRAMDWAKGEVSTPATAYATDPVHIEATNAARNTLMNATLSAFDKYRNMAGGGGIMDPAQRANLKLQDDLTSLSYAATKLLTVPADSAAILKARMIAEQKILGPRLRTDTGMFDEKLLMQYRPLAGGTPYDIAFNQAQEELQKTLSAISTNINKVEGHLSIADTEIAAGIAAKSALYTAMGGRVGYSEETMNMMKFAADKIGKIKLEKAYQRVGQALVKTMDLASKTLPEGLQKIAAEMEVQLAEFISSTAYSDLKHETEIDLSTATDKQKMDAAMAQETIDNTIGNIEKNIRGSIRDAAIQKAETFIIADIKKKADITDAIQKERAALVAKGMSMPAFIPGVPYGSTQFPGIATGPEALQEQIKQIKVAGFSDLIQIGAKYKDEPAFQEDPFIKAMKEGKGKDETQAEYDSRLAIIAAGETKIQDLKNKSANIQIATSQAIADNHQKIWDMSVAGTVNMANTILSTLDMLYQQSGQKAQIFFYMMKAVSFAQAMITGVDTMLKAYNAGVGLGTLIKNPALGNTMGLVYASIAGAFTGVQLGVIAAQTIQGPGKAEGGPIEGGSGTKDDVWFRGMGGEYVVRKEAVNKYGYGMIDAINRGVYAEPVDIGSHFPARPSSGFASGGTIPEVGGGDIIIQNNSPLPMTAKRGGVQFDGKKMVRTIILDLLDTDVGFRNQMGVR